MVVRLLVDEHEVLHAGGAVSIELDHRHVPDELAARCRVEQRRKSLEGVRRAEGAVLRIRCEHVEPSIQNELARVRHVPRAQRVDLDEIGDPLRVAGSRDRRVH